MSYLLEALGRGLLGQLLDAFENQLPGLVDDEIDDLKARRADSPTSVDLALRLGLAHLREQQFTDAQAAFEHALELAPDKRIAALGLACVSDELGRMDSALRHLSVAQAHDPSDPAIAFAIAMCNERNEQTDAAVAGYRRTLELCPRLRNAHERLAAIAIKRGDTLEATRQYEALAQLEPEDLDVLLTLASLNLLNGRAGTAVEGFQKALLIEPESADAPLADTESLTEQGRFEEALETLERLIEKYPGVSEFRVHLADFYVKVGDDGRAVEQYRAALENHPSFLEATVKLGAQHLRQRRYADAAQAFNRAVELNDRLLLAFVGLGVAQQETGSEREAEATFDLAASLAPNSTLLFSEAARLHLQSEERSGRSARLAPADAPDKRAAAGGEEMLAEAVRRHEQAVLNQPNHGDLHYRYGLLLRQVGRFDEAIQAFRNALAINPHYAKAMIKLGVCLKETGRSDEAIEVFRGVLQLDGKYVDVHYQLGLLFAQRSRFELAAEHFEHAVAGNAASTAFRQNLALALQNIGMLDKAAATWRSICELTRDSVLPADRGAAVSDMRD